MRSNCPYVSNTPVDGAVCPVAEPEAAEVRAPLDVGEEYEILRELQTTDSEPEDALVPDTHGGGAAGVSEDEGEVKARRDLKLLQFSTEHLMLHKPFNPILLDLCINPIPWYPSSKEANPYKEQAPLLWATRNSRPSVC